MVEIFGKILNMFVKNKSWISVLIVLTTVFSLLHLIGCMTRTVRVVDDCNIPISNAFVYLCEWDFIPWRYGFYGAGLYLTDTNGVVRTRQNWGARMMVGARGYWIEPAEKIHGKYLTAVLSPITSPPPYMYHFRITDKLEVENLHLVSEWNMYEKEMIEQRVDYLKNGGQWRTDSTLRITNRR